jgi:vacuolar-type H+-ATPase subunit I/STV1
MKVYEVIEARQNGETTKDVSHGIYSNQVAAQNYVKRLTKGYVSNWAYKIARMTGWKRGRNAQNFQDAIEKMANPPYRIKEIHVNTSYR